MNSYKEILEKQIHAKNSNILIINEDIYEHSYLKLKCLKCNHNWQDTFEDLKVKNFKCPKCSTVLNRIVNKNKTDFVRKLKAINPNTALVGEYTTKTTKTIFRCKTHRTKWNETPENVLLVKGKCPKCINELKNNHKIIISKANVGDMSTGLDNIDSIGLALRRLNPNIEILEEEYFGENEPILIRCKKCGNEWAIIIKELIKNYRCPNCSK